LLRTGDDMYGKALPMVRVNFLQTIDGEVVAEVDCDGYDTFVALPDAIEVEGNVLGKLVGQVIGIMPVTNLVFFLEKFYER